MPQVRIRLDDDVARWARSRAAEHETSVSRLVSEILRSRMVEEEGFQAISSRRMAPRSAAPGARSDRELRELRR